LLEKHYVNWQTSCEVMTILAIFLFFKMVAGRHLGFDKVKNDVTARCGLSMSTIMPNLITIAQTEAELLAFSVFQNGARPPSWILL